MTINVRDLPRKIDHKNTNRYVIQIRQASGDWLDYASIKDSNDLPYARRLVNSDDSQFRVIDLRPNHPDPFREVAE